MTPIRLANINQNYDQPVFSEPQKGREVVLAITLILLGVVPLALILGLSLSGGGAALLSGGGAALLSGNLTAAALLSGGALIMVSLASFTFGSIALSGVILLAVTIIKGDNCGKEIKDEETEQGRSHTNNPKYQHHHLFTAMKKALQGAAGRIWVQTILLVETNKPNETDPVLHPPPPPRALPSPQWRGH